MGGHAWNYLDLALRNVSHPVASMALCGRGCAPDHAGAAFSHVPERFLGAPVELGFPPIDASSHFSARANSKRRLGRDSTFILRFRSSSRSRDLFPGARRLRLANLLFF